MRVFANVWKHISLSKTAASKEKEKKNKEKKILPEISGD